MPFCRLKTEYRRKETEHVAVMMVVSKIPGSPKLCRPRFALMVVCFTLVVMVTKLYTDVFNSADGYLKISLHKDNTSSSLNFNVTRQPMHMVDTDPNTPLNLTRAQISTPLSRRFDLIIKMVYAYFYIRNGLVPETFHYAYTEHIRLLNIFMEYNRTSKSDFITSFHDIIKSVQTYGFVPNHSKVPVDNDAFPFNSAHRMAASIVLSKNVTFDQFDFKSPFSWSYKFFISRGLRKNLLDMVMQEWINIQVKLSSLSKSVFISSLISNNTQHSDATLEIVKEKCLIDKDILYEQAIRVNQHGMKQLVRHMYGDQIWIDRKIRDMTSKIESSTYKIRFVFFFGKSLADLNQCKFEIRKLYNDLNFKSAAHITDNSEESLILAEMILNPNSVDFLNYAENGNECQIIAKELAVRSAISPTNTLPNIYIGRDDFMFDSGSVLHLFNLRKRTDVDILFLYEVDEKILGKRNGIHINPHAFEENSFSARRAWGEDHFCQSVKTKWDLFYDPATYGFCYGVKYVSLEQLIRYKTKRGQPKDKNDVNMMKGMMSRIQHESYPVKNEYITTLAPQFLQWTLPSLILIRTIVHNRGISQPNGKQCSY